MRDFIERNDAYDNIRKMMSEKMRTFPKRRQRLLGLMVDLIAVIGNIPAADVVEVVRCRDCVWYRDHWCGNDDIPFVGDDASYFAPSETFFCPLGERRTDNG